MSDKRVYFDNAATTYPKPSTVGRAVYDFITDIGCNINRGGYESAYEAEDVIADTRSRIRRLFGGSDERNVIFTMNVTQALNIVIKGIVKAGDHVIVSSMEHNAVMRPVVELERRGVIAFSRVQCDECGYLTAEQVEQEIKPETRLVVMSHASNICGAVQPISEIGRICRERGLLFVVDAAQTAGVLDIDMDEMCIDVLCFTGHKGLLGPQGTGGFVIGARAEGQIGTIIEGGTGSLSHLETMPEFLPDRFESGTLNLPGIFGLREGIKYIEETGMVNIREREDMLRRRFIEGVREVPGVHIIAYESEDERPHVAVVSISFDRFDAASVAYRLDDEFGIQTRVGLHCAPSAHRTLGTFPQGTVRFSFGFFNTEEEIDYGIQAVRSICTCG